MLENKTGDELLLKTSSLSKEIMETKSSSITGGVMFDKEAMAAIGIPLFRFTEYTRKLEVTVGESKDYSTSISISYTAYTQENSFPPNNSINIMYNLLTVSIQSYEIFKSLYYY